VKDSLIISNHL